MRNSDPDAAIYWMMRMLEGGENPLYIARRLIRFASEDVGMADSHALQVAVAAYQACISSGCPSVMCTSLMQLSTCLWRPSPMPFTQPAKPQKRM